MYEITTLILMIYIYIYIVKEAYVLILNFEVVANSPLYIINWNNLIPSKISLLFEWRLQNDHLPTRNNLILKGVQN